MKTNRSFIIPEDISHRDLKAYKKALLEAKDLSKEELIEITKRILLTDKHQDFYLQLLEKNILDPAISDLIFWPSQRGYDRELSAEEIVEIALNYKPIYL